MIFTSINDVLSFLYSFKENSCFSTFINKIFLYQKKVAVIEIIKNGRRFALDISLTKEKSVNVRLVWRKEAAQYAYFYKFEKIVSTSELASTLEYQISRAIDFIDKNGDILVSVIVPMHNSEKHIQKLINIFHQQTIGTKKFEVIYIDDESCDETINLVEKYSEGLVYRIIKRQCASGNASAPRNDGIRLAIGDYILFVDADDLIAEYTLKDAYEFAQHNNSDVVYLKLEGLNGRVLATRPWSKGNVAIADIYKNYLFMSFQPTKLFRTSFIRMNNFYFDRSFLTGEDKLFVMTAVTFAKNISILADKSYAYIIAHEGDHLSKKTDGKEDLRLYKILSTVLSSALLLNSEKGKKIYNVLLYRFAKFYFNKMTANSNRIAMANNIINLFSLNYNLFEEKYIYADGISDVMEVVKKFKAQIDFSEMPKLFHDINLSEIGKKRDSLMSISRDWIKEAVKPVEFKNFNFNRNQSRYSIDYDGVRFECLFINNNKNKLIISLGGGGRGSKPFPQFYRWKYANFLDANIFCIDDPMYYNRKFTGVKWYYGTKDTSYLKLMLPILYKVIEELNVKFEDVTFLGSSGGGYAAIYLANLIDGTTAIALSPQYDIGHLNPKDNKNFMEEDGIDLLAEDKHGRNVLKLSNSNSLFVLVENCLSEMDWERQFVPFCERHGIDACYGITQHKNIITWVHASDGIDTHTCNPEKEYLSFLCFLISEYKKGKNINGITAFSYLLNETLNDKYTLQKHEFTCRNTLNALAHITEGNYKIQSFHKKTLSYNIDKKEITTSLTEDSNIKFINAKIKQGKIFFYVNELCLNLKNMNLENQENDVLYIGNSDLTFSFIMNKKYMSAREDGDIKFVDNNKDWEHFYMRKE